MAPAIKHAGADIESLFRRDSELDIRVDQFIARWVLLTHHRPLARKELWELMQIVKERP